MYSFSSTFSFSGGANRFGACITTRVKCPSGATNSSFCLLATLKYSSSFMGSKCLTVSIALWVKLWSSPAYLKCKKIFNWNFHQESRFRNGPQFLLTRGTHLCSNSAVNRTFGWYTIMIKDHGTVNVFGVLNPLQCLIHFVG